MNLYDRDFHGAVTFTVNNRPYYFTEVLDSWRNVRGLEEWLFLFNIEPSGVFEENECMAIEFLNGTKVMGFVYQNEERLGVLNNPFMGFDRAFKGPHMADYVILAEDDLLVSTDILEYHNWAARTYRDDKDIAMVCSFTEEFPIDKSLDVVHRVPNFASVSIWGTWRDRWGQYIAPTWDHDYSSSPGMDCGWDWNLNLRVLPAYKKFSIQPEISRVQNIGRVGQHAGTGNFHWPQAIGFVPNRPVCFYHEV